MALEAVAALVVAMAALGLVLHPLIYPPASRPRAFEPVDPDETPKGLAFIALKEIEFDRETGKLSDSDYDSLKAEYTAMALDALRKEQAGPASDDLEAMIAAKVRSLRSASATTPSDASIPACPTCGPRPEADAMFCSHCGHRLPTSLACGRCGAALVPGSKFCEACGRPVAA